MQTHEQSFEAAESVARAILDARPEVMGFDIEWQVSFVAGEVTMRLVVGGVVQLRVHMLLMLNFFFYES